MYHNLVSLCVETYKKSKYKKIWFIFNSFYSKKALYARG